MLIGLSEHSWMFASLAWIVSTRQFQETCGFADLLTYFV
jgi:hypothetical protein